MFGLGAATRIYLAAGATDMRKGFEGLYGLVRDRLQCEPLSGAPFRVLECATESFEAAVLGWQWIVGMRQASGERAFPLAESRRREGVAQSGGTGAAAGRHRPVADAAPAMASDSRRS